MEKLSSFKVSFLSGTTLICDTPEIVLGLIVGEQALTIACVAVLLQTCVVERKGCFALSPVDIRYFAYTPGFPNGDLI